MKNSIIEIKELMRQSGERKNGKFEWKLTQEERSTRQNVSNLAVFSNGRAHHDLPSPYPWVDGKEEKERGEVGNGGEGTEGQGKREEGRKRGSKDAQHPDRREKKREPERRRLREGVRTRKGERGYVYCSKLSLLCKGGCRVTQSFS